MRASNQSLWTALLSCHKCSAMYAIRITPYHRSISAAIVWLVICATLEPPCFSTEMAPSVLDSVRPAAALNGLHAEPLNHAPSRHWRCRNAALYGIATGPTFRPTVLLDVARE